MFWSRKKPKEPVFIRTLTTLKPCFCGCESFIPLRADDACYCSHCGAMFLIGRYQVESPVADWEEIEAT